MIKINTNFKLNRYYPLAIMLCIQLSFNAQKAYNFNNKLMKDILKSETIKVVLTGNEVFDSKLNAAFNKFWNVSKFEFITMKQFSNIEVEQGTNFSYGNFKLEHYPLEFSKLMVIVNTKKNQMYKMIEIPFDNLTNTKTGETDGADDTQDEVLSKIEPYIMLMNSQLKKQIDLGNMDYDRFSGEKEKIKSKKIFIQEDYFLNNLDKNLLQDLNFKVETLSQSQIKNILNDKSLSEGYGWLCLVNSPMEISAFIIDLNSGDLLNFAKIDKSSEPKKKLDNKTLSKLIKMLNKEK